MRLIRVAFAAILLMGSGGVASAAPIMPPAAPAGQTAQTGGLVQKVHAWHYRCAWGPVRFHRHVDGIGNVRCRRRIRRRYYPRYRPRRPRVNCEARFYICKDDWGTSKSRGFFRCMNRVGCQ